MLKAVAGPGLSPKLPASIKDISVSEQPNQIYPSVSQHIVESASLNACLSRLYGGRRGEAGLS